MIAIKDTLMKEKSLLISRHSFVLFSSSALFILLFHYQNYSRLPPLPILSVPSLCAKYQPLIPPTLPPLYPLPSLSVFPSPLFSPASFLLVARLLLLCELFNFMPGFLSASAQSHKVSLSSQCHKISLNNCSSLIYLQLRRSLNYTIPPKMCDFILSRQIHNLHVSVYLSVHVDF